MLRRTLKIQTPPPPGRFRIVITAVRADETTVADATDPAWYRGEVTRNEETSPEKVINTIALSTFSTQRYTQRYARSVALALGARFMAHHRVKVVAVPR